MGFDIPEPYCWDESFKVFYDNLDEEHKGLFNAIFAVSKTPADGAALATLKKKVDEHFHNEEGMMKKANYPDFASHSQLHADFVQKLAAVAAPVSDDIVKFAKEWLVNHIKTTDFQYKEKL